MSEIIDYARSLILIEQMTRQVSDLCLDKKFDEAIELSRLIAYHLSVLQVNLAKMSKYV
jgi:hypothetical protein